MGFDGTNRLQLPLWKRNCPIRDCGNNEPIRSLSLIHIHGSFPQRVITDLHNKKSLIQQMQC